MNGVSANFSSSSPLYIGYNYGGSSNTSTYGQLTLGSGTLNATSITLAQSQWDNSTLMPLSPRNADRQWRRSPGEYS